MIWQNLRGTWCRTSIIYTNFIFCVHFSLRVNTGQSKYGPKISYIKLIVWFLDDFFFFSKQTFLHSFDTVRKVLSCFFFYIQWLYTCSHGLLVCVCLCILKQREREHGGCYEKPCSKCSCIQLFIVFIFTTKDIA